MADSSKSRRSCFCTCFLWTTILLALIILLAAVAGVIFWAVYHPHHPTFMVSSVHLSQFLLTPTHLNSDFKLVLTARNPNKKIVFVYDSFNISAYSDDVDIGSGSLPGFVHGLQKTTTLPAVVASSGQSLESADFFTLRSDLKRMNGLALKIELGTKVQMKIGSLRTKKMGMRVTCDAGRISIPGGKSEFTSNGGCKVRLRFKIWK